MSNKYPWIGQNEFGHTFVFYGDGVVYSHELEKFVTDSSYFALCKNVTNEFLRDKYVKTSSDEHHSFVLKLATENGIKSPIMTNEFIAFCDCDGFISKVEIPLPPKSKPETKPEQWEPKVGDLVKDVSDGSFVEVIAASPDNENRVCVKSSSGRYSLRLLNTLSKMRDDDILRKDVLGMLSTFNPHWNPEDLLDVIEGAGFKVVRK